MDANKLVSIFYFIDKCGVLTIYTYINMCKYD